MTPLEPDRRRTAFAAASVPQHYQQRLAPVVFEPWAEILVAAVGVRAGQRVLDVASGTGVAARLAARFVGTGGRVVASDVSAAMLVYAATFSPATGSAQVEYVEAPADALPFRDGSFDVVLCQQGLQFFSDRPAAAREMRRVLGPGGVVGAAVWAAGSRLEPFDDYVDALVAAGVQPPFPRAFEHASYVMGSDEVRELLDGAGFSAVQISVVEHVTEWPDSQSAAAGILGTPFGPLVDALPGDRRGLLDADLARRFAPPAVGAPIRRATTAVVARATVVAT